MKLLQGLMIVAVALAVSGCGAVLQRSDPQSVTLRECTADRSDVFAFQCYCANDNTGG